MQLKAFIIYILFGLFDITLSAPADSSPPVLHARAGKIGSHNQDALNVDRKKVDYYEYRHVVAEGVQKALDECRDKFKWDRWNCPKKAFLDILDRNPLPSNKELGYTRALIASSIVLSLTRSCSYGTNSVCGCINTNSIRQGIIAPNIHDHPAAGMIVPPSNLDGALTNNYTVNPVELQHSTDGTRIVDSTQVSKFAWQGCDEIITFGFKVSKIYLESQDMPQNEASRWINSHNYEVGRIAVKRSMKKKCKCHGISGSCQMNTCWTTLPDMSKVGEYLRRQHKLAAKVGASSAEETNIDSLNKELSALAKEKLVFSDSSPDYCYENTRLGINGTLGRYCSRAKHHKEKTEVTRSERESCDNLCTKCGYKIKRERLSRKGQCDCRFLFCCSVECKTCTHVEDTYRCVRHS